MLLKKMIIRLNMLFPAFFFILYGIHMFCRSAFYQHQDSTLIFTCSLGDCFDPKMEKGIKMKATLEEPNLAKGQPNARRKLIKREKPSFLSGIEGGMRIGMINMDDEDVSEWEAHGQIIPVSFEPVSDLLEWKHLYPEWIDEEDASCPEIPMANYEKHEYMDMIVAKLPCKILEEGWNRDVFWLQVHLVLANLVVRRGRKDGEGKTKVVLLSECRPMVELFGCDEFVIREGEWWYYRLEMEKLEQKVALPVGSCKLAWPQWGKGTNHEFDVSKIKGTNKLSKTKREAYATVLHSSETYVCGAITLAQTLLQTQTQRDLILLLDSSISEPKREALAQSGWTLRIIKRIRNPKAQKNSYNEYNYSKFRLWQLTDYDKIIFIDSDILVLRNLDYLFQFPQISAVANANSFFNSGIMVIEPSNCTFRLLLQKINNIVSYNGGDQGFLNEIFVWWHRLPRKVNFFKIFRSNFSNEAVIRNKLYGLDPPEVYSLHFFGLKPWLCYRDYDCNFDVTYLRIYASDVAHAQWWKVHDAMDQGLQKFCMLSEQRKIQLESSRTKAKKQLGLIDKHWKINVTDPRRFSV